MKLTNFKTPTGATGNILDPSSWLQLILGTMVLLITFAVGQNLTSRVGERARFVDTSIEQPYKSNNPVQTANKKEVI